MTITRGPDNKRRTFQFSEACFGKMPASLTWLNVERVAADRGKLVKATPLTRCHDTLSVVHRSRDSRSPHVRIGRPPYLPALNS